MKRKTRAVLANSAIAASALVGGVLLTNHYTESSGGIPAAIGLVSNTTGTTAAGGTDQKVTGDAFQYQYGVIQLEVERKGGKLTAINLIQAGATAGREQAFPYLVQYALQAQGTDFTNLSGATFTTDIFKQALSSAISKLN